MTFCDKTSYLTKAKGNKSSNEPILFADILSRFGKRSSSSLLFVKKYRRAECFKLWSSWIPVSSRAVAETN